MVSAYAALQEDVATPETTFECEGIVHEGRRHQPFRCWVYPGRHGKLNLYQALAQSCNIYFFELVRQNSLTSDHLAKWARNFGLGTKTGIGLGGEAEGIVPDAEWKQEEKRESWTRGDTMQFAIGEQYLVVTPLQMAVVTAAVANGGKVLRPQLVRKIEWPKWTGRGTELLEQPEVLEEAVDPAILKHVQQGMRLGVAGQHGTSRSIMRDLGVKVAGKTGSAQHSPGRRTHAWYVCYAPYEDPRYAICVFVEEGGHGGSTAAPVARALLAAAFGLEAPPPLEPSYPTD
jgi:penicillin-binding protein 2